MSERDVSVLDNPAWSSLSGPHAYLAIGTERARRYPLNMSPFAAISDDRDPQAWADLAALVGPGARVGMSARTADLPDGWQSIFSGEGAQMIGPDVAGLPDAEAVVLTDADVPEMLELVQLTQPGPFEERTIDFGGYLGFRRDGRLAAMAGRRLHPDGWVEISAVCTHPDFQRQGLASRLVLAVAHGIQQDGLLPFLHVRATNEGAIRVYENLGFSVRRHFLFEQLRSPEQ